MICQVRPPIASSTHCWDCIKAEQTKRSRLVRSSSSSLLLCPLAIVFSGNRQSLLHEIEIGFRSRDAALRFLLEVLPALVWVEVQSPAVEVDRGLEVLAVAEAARGVADQDLVWVG